MAMNYSREDEIVAYHLKMMIYDENYWPHFLPSEDVYGVNPWSLFKTRNPLELHDGGYFFVNLTEESGKTDGCESGCWRVMGGDKLIKSEDNETKKVETLGFKKVLKFCEKEKLRSIYKFVEIEKRRVRDKRVWVMEEYRLKGIEDYVICKIRLLLPIPLGFMLSNHIRGYYI